MQEFLNIPTDTLRQAKRGSPFSETDAIADILTMADENGEFYSTTRKLMKRWKWGNSRVTSLMKELEKQDVIKTQTRHKQDTLYIVNKRFFECTQDTNKTQTRHKQDTNESVEKAKQDTKPSENEPKKKEDNLQMLNRLLPNYPLSDVLSDKIREWIEYKMARKDSYVEQGMKSLLKKISENAQKSGDFAVMDLIDMCMSNNWKGIIWDKLETKKNNGNRDILDEWRNS